MAKDRIVVGVDFSEPSQDSARWAARQFAGSEIVLTHIISLPAPPAIVSNRYPRHDLLVETVREGADRRLRDLSTSLGDALVWMEIREGAVAPTLAAVAVDYGARLIVVGAHGERARVAGSLGTTAHQVVRETGIPVLLATHLRDAPISHVLAAVDDEVLARQALRWAVTLAGAGGRVTALHVGAGGVMNAVMSAAGIASGVTPVMVPPKPGAPDRWAELARAAGIPADGIESEEAVGDAVTEIVGTARRLNVDLIVMGRRAAGGFRRAVLGSVTDGVLRHAECSVLVVPEPAERETRPADESPSDAR